MGKQFENFCRFGLFVAVRAVCPLRRHEIFIYTFESLDGNDFGEEKGQTDDVIF